MKTKILAIISLGMALTSTSEASIYGSTIKTYCYGKAALGIMTEATCLQNAVNNTTLYIQALDGITASNSVATIEAFENSLRTQALGVELLKVVVAPKISFALASAKTAAIAGDHVLVLKHVAEARAALVDVKTELSQGNAE